MPVIVITGGSSGIGAGLAVEMVRRGYDVGIIARRAEKLEAVAAEARSVRPGGKCVPAAADVTDAQAVADAVSSIEDQLGVTDIMVCNAGGGGPMPLRKWSGEHANQVMRLNYEGTINTLDTVVPAMRDRKSGHIVAISSVASYRGIAPGGPYSAAKAAVSTLFEALAVELRPLGVSVTTIHPGFVDTPIHGPDGPKHPVPFIIPSDKAVQIIANAIERKKRYVNFPLPMATLMYGVRALPWWAFEWAMGKAMPKPRKPRDAESS